jgi:hypothetical protein
MIYDLAIKYDAGKELLEFYVNKYNKILIASEFVKLPPIYQIGIIFEFLQLNKNIGVLVDLHNVNIFYVDPRINANNILKHYNEKGQLTDIIKHLHFELEDGFKTIPEASIYAINYVFEHMLQPF